MQEDNQSPAAPEGTQPFEQTTPQNPEVTQVPEQGPPREAPHVSWSASEFIAHHKPMSWYVGLAVALAVLSTFIYLLTRDYISPVVVLITGVLFGVFASRQPEVRTYEISSRGLVISDKLYEFQNFKSFSLHDEDAISSIFFLPVKRFSPALTVYYPPEQGDEIVRVLSDYLPLEEGSPDAIDKFMRKIRF